MIADALYIFYISHILKNEMPNVRNPEHLSIKGFDAINIFIKLASRD